MKINNFEPGDLVEFNRQGPDGLHVVGVVVRKWFAPGGIELHDVMESSGEIHTKTEMYLKPVIVYRAKENDNG